MYRLTHWQAFIFRLLLDAKTWDQTEVIVGLFGPEAAILRQLILYETIDEYCRTKEDCDQAAQILSKISEKSK